MLKSCRVISDFSVEMRKFRANPEFWHFQEIFSPFVLNMGRVVGDRRWQRELKPLFGLCGRYQSQQHAVDSMKIVKVFLSQKKTFNWNNHCCCSAKVQQNPQI